MRKIINRLRAARPGTKVALISLGVCLFAYWRSLPAELFTSPYSSVLEASNHQLLSASIASDGQWRFPESDSVPLKFEEALITFEDKRFFYHPGVDPLSLARALYHNVRERRVVSGGSTITMQVIRLSRKKRSRTIFEKGVEIILSSRLELRHTKKEILALYASHAPFGGNVVGLEAACWRYFGSRASDLSWAEAALLAVLPNSPTLIHPGKNRSLLKDKRNRLLDKLFERGKLDSLTCLLAKAEPIPEEPHPLPRHAAHLLTRMKKDGLQKKNIVSTIDYDLQQRMEQVMNDHHQILKANHVFNGAALILDVKSGSTLAYVGNVPGVDGNRGNDVDIITAPRSTGSILKPFLFAAAINEGMILPHTLLPDVPVFMNGFSPKNFSKQYDGAVHASDALIRSLNVPAVFLLKDYRYEKFYTLLNNLGLSTLHQPADHYGLSLILGGAEGSLWDITGMYASMARTLNNYFQHPGKDRYVRGDFHAPYYSQDAPPAVDGDREVSSWLSASAIYLTFESLRELYRPEEESGWKYFSTTRKIAWKTGTSFGFRDGWAVGVTPEYAVGVWVGNSDGEGRPGLTGINAAAPILFDIFSALPETGWFDKPISEMEPVITCRKSGHRASRFCESVDTLLVTRKGLESPVCTNHKMIHLSPDRGYQVHSGCSNIASMIHVSWFVLPPVEEHYFKKKNVSYKALPPWQANCESAALGQPMDLVYPKPKARLFIPRDFNGQPGSSIFELAHADENIAVYWHLDGKFIGSTRRIHKLPVNPPEGHHVLTVIDERGQSIEEQFTVISSL